MKPTAFTVATYLQGVTAAQQTTTTQRVRFAAGVLYCAAWQLAFHEGTTSDEVRDIARQRHDSLINEEPLFDDRTDPDAGMLTQTLAYIAPDYALRIADVISTLQPLSAVRTRLAYLLAAETDAERLDVACKFPAMLSDADQAVTLSNNVFRLQFAATRTAREDLVGSDARVSADEASASLWTYASRKTFAGGTDSDLPRHPTHDELTDALRRTTVLTAAEADRRATTLQFETVIVPNLQVLDNLVLFHLPDHSVRTAAGRALLRKVGAGRSPDVAAPGWYRFPLEDVDPLNYAAMKLPESTHPREEWVDTQVALPPPVRHMPYIDALARTHAGITLVR